MAETKSFQFSDGIAVSAPSTSNPVVAGDPTDTTHCVTLSYLQNKVGGLNLGLSASVATSALTVNLKQDDASTDPTTGEGSVRVLMRNTTLTSGAPLITEYTTATTLTVPSGATLGGFDATAHNVYIYAINDGTNKEIAISSKDEFDETVLHSTTALSTGSDDATVLYSTSSRSNCSIKKIGKITSTQTTAGTWDTSPSAISLYPLIPENKNYSRIHLSTYAGYGSTNTKIPYFSTTNYSLNNGVDWTFASDSTNGASFTIKNNGFYAFGFSFGNTQNNTTEMGLSLNSAALTTDLSGQTEAVRIAYNPIESQNTDQVSRHVSFFGYLENGDVVRPHTSGVAPTFNDPAILTATRYN